MSHLVNRAPTQPRFGTQHGTLSVVPHNAHIFCVGDVKFFDCLNVKRANL
jgi:hypothetical protein